MPPASLPINIRASGLVKLMPAKKRPFKNRLCSRLSGGSDPRLYLLTTLAITCSNSCYDSRGSVRQMTPRSREALPWVLCKTGCMIHIFFGLKHPETYGAPEPHANTPVVQKEVLRCNKAQSLAMGIKILENQLYLSWCLYWGSHGFGNHQHTSQGSRWHLVGVVVDEGLLLVCHTSPKVDGTIGVAEHCR